MAEPDGVLPAADRGDVGERPGQPLRQEPPARRRRRHVDALQERALALAGERARQLEIGAGRRVDLQRLPAGGAHRRRERRPRAELRALDIGEHGGGGDQLGLREGAEAVERGDAKILLDPPPGARAIDAVARHAGDGGARLAPEAGKRRIVADRVGADDLLRIDAGDLRRQRLALAGAEREASGRDVDLGKAVLPAGLIQPHPADAEQHGGAGRVEERLLGDRAGGDEPHDVAPHHGLGAALARLGRVFQLLADRDAVPGRDQPLQVIIGAMHGHAAHRDVDALVPATLGEHDSERPRGDFGILEEQLVEVAHAVEQERIRVRRLDLDILRHRRRRLAVAFRGWACRIEHARRLRRTPAESSAAGRLCVLRGFRCRESTSA